MTNGVTDQYEPQQDSSFESSADENESEDTEDEDEYSAGQYLNEALELTTFQTVQLAATLGEPKSGQEVIDRLQQEPFETPITLGQSYPNFDRLVEQGLLEKRKRNDRANEYVPTAHARDLLKTYTGWLGRVDTEGAEATDEYQRQSLDLSQFQISCLVCAASDEGQIGQDVLNKVQAVHERNIYHGRLYPNLDTLVEEGLIEKGAVDRRTNYYEITEDGLGVIETRRQWFEGRLAEVSSDD